MANPLFALADYHMHTPLCKHCTGAPWEYVKQAIERGLGEIGFSDHCPMPEWYDPDFRMGRKDMPTYLQIVQDARKRYPDYPIKFGLEADFHPGTEPYVRQLLTEWKFDYVLGSVHYLNDWGFDNPELVDRFNDRSIESIWEQYFATWEDAIVSGMFDIMAHPDLVKKFGHRPSGPLRRFYEKALFQCMKHDVAIEVSTAGLRKPVNEIYPSLDFLQLAFEYHIPIVISSDAHQPSEVGINFEEALEMVKRVGYTQVARFENRRRYFVDL
ncbi:MAG: histidinol-phosphatase HisJ family protein [Verrucomicrobiota bacterium]|nr:histidinol-phosphatase HisJ family protein [Verrucomicrobiota bacterium]